MLYTKASAWVERPAFSCPYLTVSAGRGICAMYMYVVHSAWSVSGEVTGVTNFFSPCMGF